MFWDMDRNVFPFGEKNRALPKSSQRLICKYFNILADGIGALEGQVRPVDCCRNDKLAGQFALLTL